MTTNYYINNTTEDYIISFKYVSDLHLTRSIKSVKRCKGKDANYILAKDYNCLVWIIKDNETIRKNITVPKGFITDLASSPRITRSIVGRVGSHLEASIVHDWLYVAWQYERISPTKQMRKYADDVFFASMKESKVYKWKRFLIYKAVRLFGTKQFFGKEEKLFTDII